MEQKNVLPEVFLELAQCLGCKSVKEAVEYLLKLNLALFEGNKVTMDEKDLDLLTVSVNPVRLKNNPLQLNENEIRELYKEIMRNYAD